MIYKYTNIRIFVIRIFKLTKSLRDRSSKKVVATIYVYIYILNYRNVIDQFLYILFNL